MAIIEGATQSEGDHYPRVTPNSPNYKGQEVLSQERTQFLLYSASESEIKPINGRKLHTRISV